MKNPSVYYWNDPANTCYKISKFFNKSCADILKTEIRLNLHINCFCKFKEKRTCPNKVLITYEDFFFLRKIKNCKFN